MKINLLLTFLLSMATVLVVSAQNISGTVTDGNDPLIGASVLVVGTTNGTTTDLDGTYKLTVSPGTYTIRASYIGYNERNETVTVGGSNVEIDFRLSEGILSDEVVVIGTRSNARTNLDSPVPVDVINVSKLSSVAPQVDVNQILHSATPSFSSNTQTISDGTDHIDPASLRGLGPDQVLVLVNGKRRHNSSLVNVNGTFGRGSVGTDLNAIPASAIKSIEILRDGAAAQYGSDAIAGVINIKLKEATNELGVSVTTGAHFTDSERIGPFNGEKKSHDGEVVNIGLNYGLPLGSDGGFINFTGEYNYRGATNRMKEFNGGIFNGYNAIERVAAADGADVSNLTLEDIQNYGQQVGHFDGELKANLAAMTDLSGLSGLLDYDATTEELAARGQERTDYNMTVGQSKNRGGKFFANMAIPLSENSEIYAFGGVSYRHGCSGCFYRLPAQSRTSTSIYPNGTVPMINSNIKDQSTGIGIKGKTGSWNTDFSTVYGSNEFLFNMTNTHNATLGSSSPTDFDAGGHAFSQSTTNLDLSQYFEGGLGLKGVHIAFGSEYRFENFDVIAGSEASYGNYDINSNLVTPATPDDMLVKDYFGRNRPSGSQCFAGFLPTNAVDANRSSVAGYLDTEFDISEQFLLGAAVRFENYSDFGNTFNYKATGRYKVNNNFAIRAAANSGFRAPSLHQIHFSRTSTIFGLVNGLSVAQEVGVFANTSRAAKLLGIPNLKEETSTSVSGGLTMKVPSANLRFTIDGYLVNIDDRVVLTGQFGPGDDEELQSIFDQAGATKAAFFANAISTISKGIDIVITHDLNMGNNNLRTSLAATFSNTTWDQDKGVSASPLLEEKGLVGTYFDQTARLYLEQAVPRSKLILTNTLTIDKFSIFFRNTYFGQTTEATGEGIFDTDLNLLSDATIDPYNEGKVITDLTFGYELANGVSITAGANNLLDVYPDDADPAFQSSGRFVYSRRSPQFSFGGRYVFARVAFAIK
jgi:iron complex outermembrane receptor protein